MHWCRWAPCKCTAVAVSARSGWLTAACMQARMPGTLQAGHHLNLRQELDATALLHASIRSGNAATFLEGRVFSASCVSSLAVVGTSQPSPCGGATMLTWVDSGPADMEGDVWGQTAACRAGDTHEWAFHLQGPGPPDPHRCSGWSP